MGAEIDSFTVERYHQFAALLPEGTVDILDVGCSTGRGGDVLKVALPDTRIRGLDCVEARVAKLPVSYSDGILGLSTDIPVADSSFDAVVAGEFIEHVTPEDVTATLAEFARILRPGGALLLTTPNPGYWRLKLTGRRVLGGAHLSEHPPRDLAAAVNAAGFENVRLHASGRMTRAVGARLPLWVYGSYLLEAHRSRKTPAGKPR